MRRGLLLMPVNESKILALALSLVSAISDGSISAEEARDLLEEAGDLLDDLVGLDELVAFVVDLLHRDAQELEARAVALDAKGKTARAGKLRAKAARRA